MACEVCKKSYVVSTDDSSFDNDKKPHVCDTCGRSYSLKIQLKRHILTHADGVPFVCVMCEKNVKTSDNKTYNLRLSQKGNFSCETCHKCFNTKRLLLRHASEHTAENLIECQECGENFKNATALKKHAVIHKAKKGKVKTASIRKPRTCNHCGEVFSKLKEFREHSLVHKPIQNDTFCNDNFNIKSENDDSLNLNQNDIVNKDDSNVDINNANSVENKKHTCEVCNKNFSRKSALEGHMITHFSDNHDSPLDDDSDIDADFTISLKDDKSNEQSKGLCLPKIKISLTFPCEKCKKICASKKLLDKHLKLCSAVSEESSSQQRKKYNCCNEEFECKEDYKKHKSTFHPKPKSEDGMKEQKRYICKYCEKVFFKKKNLKKHREFHFPTESQESSSQNSRDSFNKKLLKSKNFSCSVCGKRFAGETCLKKHEARHTGDTTNVSDQCNKMKKGKPAKVLICEFCNEDFTGRSYHFTKHKLSHTPEVCGICDARFVDRASLREHCRIHIGTEEGQKFLECSQKIFNAKHTATVQQPEPKVEYIYLVLR